jgi:hypothetical protein
MPVSGHRSRHNQEFVQIGDIFHLQLWAGKTYVMRLTIFISAGCHWRYLNCQILIKIGRIRASIRTQTMTAPAIIRYCTVWCIFHLQFCCCQQFDISAGNHYR